MLVTARTIFWKHIVAQNFLAFPRTQTNFHMETILDNIALTYSGRNKSRNEGLFYLQPLRVPFLMGGHGRHGSSYHYTQEARRENTEKVQRKA